MINFLNILLIILFINNVLLAQKDYEKWLTKDRTQFEKYMEEQDKKFIEFLNKEWKPFLLNDGNVLDEKPKIKAPPIKKKQQLQKSKKTIKLENINKDSDEKDNPNDLLSIPVKVNLPKNSIEEASDLPRIKPAQTTLITREFNYLSELIRIKENNDLWPEIKHPIDKQVIAEFWQSISSKDYKTVLDLLNAEKVQKHLNDWGYIQLLRELAKTVYPTSPDKQYLAIWFLTVKSGYKTQIGFKGDNLRLFLVSDKDLYGISYIRTTSSNEKKYIINFDDLYKHEAGGISTYSDEYPEKLHSVDLRITVEPKLTENRVTQNLIFNYEGKTYTFSPKINKNVVEYYKTYPHTNYDVYFNAKVDIDLRETLLKPFSEIIKGKSEHEAVNMMLRFVQTAFPYKLDKDNFGREKVLFPEETINYRYSDCEDRSILFAYMVSNLTELDIVGVDYPGHVCTAIAFSNELDGKFIKHNGMKYYICDPTYINANIGESMPEFVEAPIENVIVIRGGIR
ncbi:MAG: hypothetical protein K9N07_10600 [Candidatus Cloacimonetes bacterium]|nr:hypothetical protein [Candidatus Cloacimonadota bacterium]MCF8262297.1 hypothetical protein [Melioribacteraceae bacterium]